MELTLPILQAMVHCPYKAWRIAKESVNDSDPNHSFVITPNLKDRIAITAWNLHRQDSALYSRKKLPKYAVKAEKLLSNTKEILTSDEPPPFYKISHCNECHFKHNCYKKLRERDCISLLAGMTPKVRIKYHKKGIQTITQLSHLFKIRRRGRLPQTVTNFLWELKSLAIREKKTFVLRTPDMPASPLAIYLDFEGIPQDNSQYLLGGIIVLQNQYCQSFSFWSDRKEDEKACFRQLFDLLGEYPEAPVYHYGNYELKALKHAVKQYGGSFKEDWKDLEKRMVNLLSYLRTHVYPPTYGNGLKEVASFLGFSWKEKDADGLTSILWRKEWEQTGVQDWKEKLIRYNHDDCKALYLIHQWFNDLAENGEQENVQQVSKLQKDTPYRWQSNDRFGEDFRFINKAAYFDYQRTKIYWRNEPRKQTPKATSLSRKPKGLGRGVGIWQPKRIDEIVIAPPIKKCPLCGNKKLYQSKTLGSKKQTDIKFTALGIKQYVTEYRSANSTCSKCRKRTSNNPLKMMHYGDNLFALVVSYYVNYHISNEMISKIIQEHYGIWMSPMYLVMHKNTWWVKTWYSEAQYIRQIVLNSPVIHIDETPMKLSKESGYVWVFATTHSVFYHYTSTRKGDFLQELLKDYKGVIISDFYPVYETLNVKSQKCLIHLIRDLNDDLFKNPFDEEYKQIVSSFNTLLKKIIETIDRYGLQKEFLEKHIADTELYYKEVLEPDHSSELSVKYTKRLKRHWPELWTFLSHDGVPWNNNNAEAAVKPFAQHRRGVKGVMHERGLREYLQMLTVAQTCRYRNISFLSFLRKKRGIWENISPDALPGYLPFKQARLYMHKLGFERKMQWTLWLREGKRPSFIPCNPHLAYKKEWVSWHDWLGFSFLPFTKARTSMRKLHLKNREEYLKWSASGKRPKFIPASPEKVYKYTGWVDLSDWLGTNNKRKEKKKRLSYEEAKAYIQALGIKTQREFFEWRKAGNRPDTIPSDPEKRYIEFEGWGKFLGTERIANQNREYWSYEEAKTYLKPLNIRSMRHYSELFESGLIPQEIPKKPYSYYKKQGTWISDADFCGRDTVMNIES